MSHHARRVPSADSWNWQLLGACRGMDSAVFFSMDGERGTARSMRLQRAKQICCGCPVLAECREFALKNGESHGVWGGMSEDERIKFLNRAKRRSR
ncbi:WhiB family transcriptional regulator [Nocardia brasiliensis]|uniref:WhiB family transcriptional regulator n=1 Tax=Nocardia brasiliensis TaxID=37326 RepID=UPI00189394DC|nr:WhiB family transcriptional regulator [Nocardia brasiliensis]MBF6126583.1 WhiB family transcriptional regulator [Nocardia brasiliensis]